MAIEWRELVPTMLGSATAGMLARIPCHPIDTAKARLQVQTTQAATSYRHAGHALVAIARSEGLAGLYRGFGITFLGSAPASLLYFTSYEVAKQLLARRGEAAGGAVHFAAGMLAETVSCLLWVPIDVVKERMQVQRPVSGATTSLTYYTDTRDAFRKIAATEGILGLYRGYGATVASFGPFSALYFSFYERLKAFALARSGGGGGAAAQLPLAYQIATACTAGAAASLLTSPLDMAKLRLQVQRGMAAASAAGEAPTAAAAPFAYRNMVDGLVQIVRREGAAALFKGAGARMAFHAPTTAITMTLFERCKGLYQRILISDAS